MNRLLRITAGAGLAALNVLALQACASTSSDDGASEARVAQAAGANVLTQHNDVGRTGANLAERALSPRTVSAGTFGKLFSRTVDGAIDAQPLYVTGVDGKNLVLVATEAGSLFAFDADNAAASVPVWKASLGTPVPAADLGCSRATETGGAETVGAASTPTIDLATRTVYVAAASRLENGRIAHRLHALDLATGQPRHEAVELAATAAGVAFEPGAHASRAGLLQVGNTLYVGLGAACEEASAKHHGWVLAYDAATLKQTAVHVTTPGGEGGGIWHGGVGLGADESGGVYYVSSGGTFDGTKNFASSAVRLDPPNAGGQMPVSTWFTPGNAAELQAQDLDIGSTGALLLPGTRLLAAGSKAGVLYLVDRQRMGGLVSGDTQIAQRLQVASKGLYGSMAFYKQGGGGLLYTWGASDRLKAFTLTGGHFSANVNMNLFALTGHPGAQLAVTADGATAGTAVLWTVRSSGTGNAGIVQAFDGSDITRELWNSSVAPADALGSLAELASPTVANGKLYVGTASRELVVYGLRSTSTGEPADAGPAAPTWTQVYDTYFANPGTPGHCGKCHQVFREKGSMYTELLNQGLITPGNPSASPFVTIPISPLSWFGGSMPRDNPVPNPDAAAALTAWARAGAQNN